MGSWWNCIYFFAMVQLINKLNWYRDEIDNLFIHTNSVSWYLTKALLKSSTAKAILTILFPTALLLKSFVIKAMNKG